MVDKKIYVTIPKFTGGNVPIPVVANIMKKDKQYVRQGIIQGWLPIGHAYKKPGNEKYDYYVSPFLLWKETGYVYDGTEAVEA